ncbi:MAG: 1-acyl-sn-glycerol-3-phosphate acyltransferase [Treponema sp.]|jgi:1-acyl-sn-glycerol-3-phosphate acyltransferase|nr:1-acyl-sn-glycerol-3-phosphate acyltransferase [Treponema sp.]
MRLIRTVVVFIITGCIMIVFMIPAIIAFFLGFLGIRRQLSAAVYQVGRTWARIMIALTGCTMFVSGCEHIPRGGVCFVSNHVGIFDIVLALAYAGRPFGFIAKKELGLIPGLNVWIFLLGGLFIDRRHPRRALRTIDTGVKKLRAGGGMLIFPEGTRSRGGGLAPFHPGSLRLAAQSLVPIVPVAITGSFDVFEKDYRIAAVPVSIRFLPVINPLDIPPEDRKQVLTAMVQDRIARALDGSLRPD